MPTGIYKRTEFHKQQIKDAWLKKVIYVSCQTCKNKFKKHKSQKFCSMKCYGDSKKGSIPKNVFKKGHISWLKGTKGKVTNVNKGKIIPEWSKENHWKWIEDRTKLKKSENKMDDTQYGYWSIEVKKRDNWKCKISNSDCKGRLESHHILSWREYPELRYIINNGITLCAFHHPKKWEEEKRLSPFFQDLVSVSKEIF